MFYAKDLLITQRNSTRITVLVTVKNKTINNRLRDIYDFEHTIRNPRAKIVIILNKHNILISLTLFS